MRVGTCIFVQNYDDWDRFEAEERGEEATARPAISDRSIFLDEVGLAQIADEVGFDSLWTIEHHFTPYTMVTNPLQLLTYLAGVTKSVDVGTMVVVLPWHNPVRVAAEATAEKYIMQYSDSALRHYELLGTHLKGIKGYETYAATAEVLRADPTSFLRGFLKDHPWGTPDDIITQTKDLAATFGTSEIMFVFKYGGLPMQQAERSLRLFADEVMPALKEFNPGPVEPA